MSTRSYSVKTILLREKKAHRGDGRQWLLEQYGKADHMDGYTGADIASLSTAAVMLALREHVSKYKDPKEADSHIQELKIHMQHFEEAMKKIRPLSNQELNMYRTIAEQFGKPELTDS